MLSKGRLSGAERQAAYRQRHRDSVLAQGRTHAARRRAKGRSNPTSDATIKAQANQYAAGYRETHRADLAQKERIRRYRKSIDKMGYDAWLQTWQKQHPGETPPSGLQQTPPSVSVPIPVDDAGEVEEDDLGQYKLDRSRRRKKEWRLNDLDELEWAKERADLDAVLVGHAPDDNDGDYFLVD
ncbi:hypothetical protein FB45DRAFT_935642 [Roridomyces roridus]|uniref:Uncharacterized protein n=1 Tax=Roridomyces roridus TaxID=1738132 RepID=A0AAD7FFC1_9AGAR|nr:hypothetical protein FB45DRAFT_935642 [Roridomyces roridus]